MNLESDFTVSAPADRVWDELQDLEALAACLPGSSMRAVDGDHLLQGVLRPRIADRSVDCTATLRPIDVDEDSRSASCVLRVHQAGGPAFASAALRARVDEAGGSTRVSLSLDGRVAALELSEESARGEAERLLAELAASLEESIAERAARPAPRRQPAPAAPAAERPAARAAGGEPETPPGAAGLPVPAAAGAGAAGVLALALAAALGRRVRRRSAWFEIRYRW
jgi:carbon monoxide dehydrogenase subunit G